MAAVIEANSFLFSVLKYYPNPVESAVSDEYCRHSSIRRNAPRRQITVPTPETCSVTFWMQLLVKMRKPVMMAGPSGTGKTQVQVSQ